MCGTRIILPRVRCTYTVICTLNSYNKYISTCTEMSKFTNERGEESTSSRFAKKSNKTERNIMSLSSFFFSFFFFFQDKASCRAPCRRFASRLYVLARERLKERKRDEKMRSSRLVVQPSQLLHAAVSRDPVSLVRNVLYRP